MIVRQLSSGGPTPRTPRGLLGKHGKHEPPRRALPLPRLVAFAERVERSPSLDGPVSALCDALVRALPSGTRLDDVLHGVPFGQPAHPALVRFPLGCWSSAVL